MPKILDISYAGELGAANYILGIRDGKAVRFPVEVFEDEPVVNSSFVSLTDTPTNYVDQAGKLAAVNSTETGLEFIDAPTSLPAGGVAGQVLTKNSSTEGDAGWAEASGGTEITVGTTPPTSPVDGQLWIDESQGVQDQNNFIDVTNFTTDYPLRRGETAVVNFTTATVIYLNIKLADGIYDIDISCLSNTSMGSTANVALEPNNTTYASAIKESYVDSRGGSANNTTLARFIFALDMILRSSIRISTRDYSKTMLAQTMYKNVSNNYASRTSSLYWDGTVAWTSLGLLRFAFAQSGTIIIRRIY